jgi:hypothetical protein
MPGWWRLLAFGGAVLLAISAWTADQLAVSIPLWAAGLAALSVAWWKGAISTVLAGALVCVPLLLAPPLGSSDVYSYACQGWLWIHGTDPYTTGVLDGGCPWASDVPEVWWHTPAPYGPLAIAISGLAAATGSLTAAVAVLRLAALAAATLLAWQLPKLAALVPRTRLPHLATPPGQTRLQGPKQPPLLSEQPDSARPPGTSARSLAGSSEGRPPGGTPPSLARWAAVGGEGKWVLVVGVMSPLVLVHGISGAHHDLLMTALIVAAFAIAPGLEPTASSSRTKRTREALLAGVLIAAAVGIKVTAIVALPFLLLLIGKRWVVTLAAATVTFAGLTALTGLGWIKALAGTGSVTQWSSPPTAVGMTVSYVLRLFGVDSPLPVTIARAIGILALAVIAIVLLRQTWQKRQNPIVACGLLLAAMTLLGPVFYPWYAILPVAFLAISQVPGKWLLAAVLVCTALSLPNGDGIPALTKLPGALLVTAAVIYYGVRKLSPVRAA